MIKNIIHHFFKFKLEYCIQILILFNFVEDYLSCSNFNKSLHNACKLSTFNILLKLWLRFTDYYNMYYNLNQTLSKLNFKYCNKTFIKYD